MNKIKELKQKISQFWESIDSRHRMWLRLYLYFSTAIFLVVMVALYFHYSEVEEEIMARNPVSSSEETAQLSSDSELTSTDSTDDSLGLELSLKPAPLASVHQEAHRDLIHIYHKLGLYSSSLKHIEAIREFYEQDTTFLSEAGKAFHNSGNSEKALEFFEKAITNKASSPELLRDFAMANFRAQKVIKARSLLKGILTKDPKNADVIRDLAVTYMEEDKHSSLADSLFKASLKLNPKNAKTWYSYGRMSMNAGNYFQSQKRLEKSLELDPLNSKIYGRLGMLQYYLRNFEKAEQLYRTTLGLNPTDFTTWYNLGELYFTDANRKHLVEDVSNKQKQSLEAFLSTLKLNKNHPWAHYKVGVLLNNNQQYKEALRHFKIAYAAFPKNADLLLQMAVSNEKIGNEQEALAHLENAYYIDPFNKVISSKLKSIKSNTKI